MYFLGQKHIGENRKKKKNSLVALTISKKLYGTFRATTYSAVANYDSRPSPQCWPTLGFHQCWAQWLLQRNVTKKKFIGLPQ
jgi:hypothetical protein